MAYAVRAMTTETKCKVYAESIVTAVFFVTLTSFATVFSVNKEKFVRI